MSKKGGYQIIDLKGTNFSSDSHTIPGIYESIEGNYHKPLLLSGIVLAGVEYADVFVTVEKPASNYEITAYGHKFTVTSEDSVTESAVEAVALKAATKITTKKESAQK